MMVAGKRAAVDAFVEGQYPISPKAIAILALQWSEKAAHAVMETRSSATVDAFSKGQLLKVVTAIAMLALQFFHQLPTGMVNVLAILWARVLW